MTILGSDSLLVKLDAEFVSIAVSGSLDDVFTGLSSWGSVSSWVSVTSFSVAAGTSYNEIDIHLEFVQANVQKLYWTLICILTVETDYKIIYKKIIKKLGRTDYIHSKCCQFSFVTLKSMRINITLHTLFNRFTIRL